MIQLDKCTAMKKDTSYAATSQSGVKWPQFMAGFLASGGALCGGAIMGWSLMQYDSNYASNRALEDTNANEDPLLVLSLLTVGALQGAIPAGFLADILGRKLLLLLMAGIFWIAGILLIIAPHVAWLVYTSRFLSGFATGCTSVLIPLYNEEIAEAHVRGVVGVMYEVNFCAGVLLSCLMQMIFPNFTVPILHFILPMLFFITFLWMPESPMYLISRGKHTKAERSIQWLRTSKSHPLYDIGAELQTMCSFLENTKFKKLSKYYLEDSGNGICCGHRKGSNILIVCILMLIRPTCGAYALIAYRKIFFEASGFTTVVISFIVSIFMFSSNFISMYLVDRVGRRVLMLCSLGGTTVCQVLFAQYFYLRDHDYDVTNWKWVCLILFEVFLILYSVGLGPLTWLLMAETLPAESKRWAAGLASSINWLMIFLVTVAFFGFLDTLGHTSTFGLFFILNVLGIIFVTLFFPETKGCSREEIQ